MPNDYNESRDTVTIYGCRRKVADWVNDPLCRVAGWIFRQRLKTGMDAETALSRPTVPQRSVHSQLRGVTYHKAAKLWVAQIKVNGTLRQLGYYKSELEAGMAYDAAAKQFHGPDAKLNFH
jgi:hypothetical protein